MSRIGYCPECGRPVILVRDAGSERTGWTCRDTRCPGGRRFVEPSRSPEGEAAPDA